MVLVLYIFVSKSVENWLGDHLELMSVEQAAALCYSSWGWCTQLYICILYCGQLKSGKQLWLSWRCRGRGDAKKSSRERPWSTSPHLPGVQGPGMAGVVDPPWRSAAQVPAKSTWRLLSGLGVNERSRKQAARRKREEAECFYPAESCSRNTDEI